MGGRLLSHLPSLVGNHRDRLVVPLLRKGINLILERLNRLQKLRLLRLVLRTKSIELVAPRLILLGPPLPLLALRVRQRLELRLRYRFRRRR